MSTLNFKLPEEEEEEEKVFVAKSGRVFRPFEPPIKNHAALAAAQKHLQKHSVPVTVHQRVGYIEFERQAQTPLEEYNENIHPQATFYPSIHRAPRTKSDMLRLLATDLEKGLDDAHVRKEQRAEVQQTEDDVLDGLEAAGTTGLFLSLSTPVHRVIRKAEEHVVTAEQLVKGDVIRLMPGDVVPTDMYVAEVFTRPCVIVRRCVQDYCDFVSIEKALSHYESKDIAGGAQAIRSGNRPGEASPLAGAESPFSNAASPTKSVNESFRSTGSAAGRTPSAVDMDDPVKRRAYEARVVQERARQKAERKGKKTDGWTSGVRVCLPVVSEGSIISHGDVVQWGECKAICITDPKDSSWAEAWRTCLRSRAIRAEEMVEKQAQEKRKRDNEAQQRKKSSMFGSLLGDGSNKKKTKQPDLVISPELAKQMKALSRLGVFVDNVPVASILTDITCIIIEDDIRFRELQRPNDLGIGVGPTIDEDELHFRYDDLLNMAQRAGIAVLVLLRRNGTTSLEASRLARWLRFAVCSDSVNHFDLQTPSLYALFEHGGAVCRIDSKISSASELVDNIQRCNAQVMNPTYHRQVVQALRNPHGVLSHIVQNGTYQPPQISQDSLTQRGGTVEEDNKVEQERTKKLMQNLIQDDEELPRRHLVAYVGEDWGGLSAADIPITWSSTMSPGGYEARKMAAIRLRENSPARLLQALTEFEMKRYSGVGIGSQGCAIA